MVITHINFKIIDVTINYVKFKINGVTFIILMILYLNIYYIYDIFGTYGNFKAVLSSYYLVLASVPLSSFYPGVVRFLTLVPLSSFYPGVVRFLTLVPLSSSVS